MRTLTRPFGPVNLRAFAAGLHRHNLNGALTPPVIATPPIGATVVPGQAVNLVVVASGTGPFTYQWLFNGRYVVNATGPTLAIASMRATDAGTYAVEVTNAFDTVTSADATLVLAGPPRDIVTTPPSLAAVTAGNAVTFTVSAQGTPPLTYQWRKNGSAIAGATQTTLTLTGVTAASTGTYDVIVSNALGSSVSASIALVVATTPP
jgi:hypothetical protein